MEVTDHQRNVIRALEGNERVYYHESDNLIAVWHGGPQIQIFDSRSWENFNVVTVRTSNKSQSQIEKRVEIKLRQMGYNRSGRYNGTTAIVKN